MFRKPQVVADEKKIDEILNRGIIVEILPNKEKFKELLLSGKQLHFYWGADATAATLHLSHAKNYILLEEIRKLGHKVTILFGDFTAKIGDPTDQKDGSRSRLTSADVKNNIKKWKELISPIVDFKDKTNPPNVVLNSKWLSKLSFEDVVDLASSFTVQQMIERDMFQKRIKEGKPIFLHEFMYPLMQGYDSVELDVDVECCGTDQIFNALAGRTLLKKYKNKEKFVVAVNLMENPKTGELMSKSRGTGVFLDTSAEEMYGSVMAQPDEMISVLYINITRLPLDDLNKLKIENPKDFKMFVAKEIVKIFFGKEKSEKAEQHFVNTFSKKIISENIIEFQIENGIELCDFAIEKGFVSSKSDFRRLVDSGAVSVFNGEKISDSKYKLQKEEVIRVGKKNIFKIKIKN
jgi:tyrosyl-tRNA synthetase